MKKEDILKVLEESNKVLGKLTDKQLEQYASNEEYKKGTALGGYLVGGTDVNKNRVREMQKTACILGGKAQGPIQAKKNVESGLISSLGKQMSKFNNRLRVCPYCEIETKGIGYSRWHGENCKWKTNKKPILKPKININEQINICPHCSKEIKGRNYFKWHGENCKFKK